MAKWNWESAHRGNRCGHAWCTGCRTRRGHNRGNRRLRHAIRTALRFEVKQFPRI